MIYRTLAALVLTTFCTNTLAQNANCAAAIENEPFLSAANLRLILDTLNPSHGTTPAFEAWDTDGFNADSNTSYSRAFFAAVGGRSLEEYAKSRHSEGLTTHALDLFGSALFTSNPAAFDSLTGVRFLPIDPSRVPPQFRNANWNEVTGDLSLRRTWTKLDVNRQSRGIKSYDLILMRPDGPVTEYSYVFMEDNPDPAVGLAYLQLSHSILKRAWRMLSDRDGMMLVQLAHPILRSDRFKLWVHSLREAGVKVDIFEKSNRDDGISTSAMRLIKTVASPKELP